MYNMSSFRTFGLKKTLPTNIVNVNTISYTDSIIDDRLPIPFTVRNGVLDIAIQDSVTADLLNPDTYNDEFSEEAGFQASLIGGNYPVDSLGPNMLTFLKNFIAEKEGDVSEYNLVTNIEIYNAPTMTKLRFNYIREDDSWTFTDEPPVKTTPNPLALDASPSNSYRIVAIFKSPLVVSYKFDGSNTKYLTFTSALDIA
jgi:hypothetical protein